MLILMRRLVPILVIASWAAPAAAQDFVGHRAFYNVTTFERGKPGDGTPIGTYAYELRLTCDGYAVNARMRLELDGGRATVVSEQQSQMEESRDGKKFRFEHRAAVNGKQTTFTKGEASLQADGGQARFSEPEGQTVALSAATMFPVGVSRAAVRAAKAGETSFDALLFFGDKVKPPEMANGFIGKVPRRLAELPMPEGSDALTENHASVYFRVGFFDAADAKGRGEPVYEMSSLTLDNGIELFGTHEESDSAIEYKIGRLEALPKPTCN
jgi:EipB-like